MYILLVCGCWNGKHLSVGGWLVFINSMMTSMILFICYASKSLIKRVLEKIDYYRFLFF
jgi:hypothetical protein